MLISTKFTISKMNKIKITKSSENTIESILKIKGGGRYEIMGWTF